MLLANLKKVLDPLCTVYFDATGDNPKFPLLVVQQVGGEAYSYLEQKLPDHRNARIQITVWAKDRIGANRIAFMAEEAIIEKIQISEPIGAVTGLYQESPRLYGTRQDFSIWYKKQ